MSYLSLTKVIRGDCSKFDPIEVIRDVFTHEIAVMYHIINFADENDPLRKLMNEWRDSLIYQRDVLSGVMGGEDAIVAKGVLHYIRMIRAQLEVAAVFHEKSNSIRDIMGDFDLIIAAIMTHFGR